MVKELKVEYAEYNKKINLIKLKKDITVIDK